MSRGSCFGWRPIVGVVAVGVLAFGWTLHGSPASPSGSGEEANVVSFSSGEIGKVPVPVVSPDPIMVRATITGKQAVATAADPFADRERGDDAPVGGVADVGDPCDCDLDCGDGNVCTVDTCVAGLCAQTMAAAETPCPSDTTFCMQGTCDGAGTCVDDGEGGDPCDAGEVCNETTDHCDGLECGVPADCTEDPGPCRSWTCEEGFCVSNWDCAAGEGCDTQTIPEGECIVLDGRCCDSAFACTVSELSACNGGADPWASWASDDCICPKYSSGLNENDGADNPFFIEMSEQPCELFNRVGDDYTIANGSFLSLESFSFLGGIHPDGTGDGTVVFEFYDNSDPPIPVLAAAVGFDPNTDRGAFIWTITLNTPTPIPPEGFFVMRPGVGSGESPIFFSANAVGLVGSNNPDLMWINIGPRSFLQPDAPDMMAFELKGTKVAPPLGACCNPLDGTCEDNYEWECIDLDRNWQEGMLCIDDPCTTGTCCLADGSCIVETPAGCTGAGGTFGDFGATCDINCCDQPTATGGNLCSDATVHAITVPPIGDPPVYVTITGTAEFATDGLCTDGLGGGSMQPCRRNGDIRNPAFECPVGEFCDTSDGDCADLELDPLWWEAFSIDEAANVTIDFCCTDEGEAEDGLKGRFYIVIADGCDPGNSACGELVFYDADASGGVCPEGNPSATFPLLPAGTYYYPILADGYCDDAGGADCTVDADCNGVACLHGDTPYQLHITVEPLPAVGCCVVTDGITEGYCTGGIAAGQLCDDAGDCILGTCTFDIGPACVPFGNEVDCDALGGIVINNPSCTGEPCSLGACCLGAGECQDNGGSGITYADCVDTLQGQYKGGVRCEADDPCPVCPLDPEADCQPPDGDYILRSDRVAGVRIADDFSPTAGGAVERICWTAAYYDSTNAVECYEPDNPNRPNEIDFPFIVRFYADAAGMPGAEIGPPGGEELAIDAADWAGGNSRTWEMSAPVSVGPVLTPGECYWIEITGLGIEDACGVYWAQSNSGNAYSFRDSNDLYEETDVAFTIDEDNDADVGFCVSNGLIAGSCARSGACCECGGVCNDGVDLTACRDSGGTPLPFNTCADDVCPPSCANDTCPTAIDLNAAECAGGLPCTFATDNRCCEVRVTNTNCTVAPGGTPESTEFGQDHWWTWDSGATSGTVTASMCDGPSYDGIMAVYDGGADCSVCPTVAQTASPLVCGDDTCGVGGGVPVVEWEADPNTCYFIRVGGWNDSTGVGEVTLTAGGGCPATAAPLPDDRFGITIDGADTSLACVTTTDCLAGLAATSQVDCIAGTCYVRMNKYISMDADPANAGLLTARRVSLSTGEVLGWVGQPTAVTVSGNEDNSPQLLSRIVDTPYFTDWTTLDSVHVGDCEVSPGYIYRIQEIEESCNQGDEGSYSAPLELRTVAKWGDVSGNNVGQPPDGGASISFKDISAIVRGFQGVQREPKCWLDLQGGTSPATAPVPNFGDIAFGDISRCVAAFQGASYPFDAPLACP